MRDLLYSHLDRERSSVIDKFFFNSSMPSELPSLASQLDDSAPYDMPSTPTPKVKKDDTYTAQVGMSRCLITCTQHTMGWTSSE